MTTSLQGSLPYIAIVSHTTVSSTEGRISANSKNSFNVIDASGLVIWTAKKITEEWSNQRLESSKSLIAISANF